MPKPSYATESDLKLFIQSTGLIDAADVNGPPFNKLGWKAKLTRAQEMLEVRTGRVFGTTRANGTSTSVTRTYDPPHHPRGRLMLGTEMIGTPVITISGITQVLNTDFYLGPENADAEGKPWEWIEFPNFCLPSLSGFLPRRSFSITGDFTYSDTIPDDIWDAHICCAAALLAPQLELTITNGLISVEENSLKVTYSGSSQPTPLFGQTKSWLAQFAQTCSDKKRVTVGFG